MLADTWRRTAIAVGAAATLTLLPFQFTSVAHAAAGPERNVTPPHYGVQQGSFTIQWDPAALGVLRWNMLPSGQFMESSDDDRVAFAVLPQSKVYFVEPGAGRGTLTGASLQTRGGIMLDHDGTPVPIGYLALENGSGTVWSLFSGIHKLSGEHMPLGLGEVSARFDPDPAQFTLTADVTVSADWARENGIEWAAGTVIGTLTVDARVERRITEGPDAAEKLARASALRSKFLQLSAGPDLLVAELQSVRRYGRIGDVTAYSIGTTVCNVGDARTSWIAGEPDHPVVSQQLYRLRGGRFEQIGMSWVKHTFISSNGTLCSGQGGCTFESEVFLGVGCSDIYTSTINGSQPSLALRSQVNATTGELVWPYTRPDVETLLDRRIQVHDADLDPEINEGALYFLEGQYVAEDEAAAGNQDDNASHRPAVVQVPNGAPEGYFAITQSGFTQRGRPAILAWRDNDQDVRIEIVDVPGDRRFILGCKVTPLGGGLWHYEYALHNLNSDRSGQKFTVPIPAGVTVLNPGFHDVDYHSGSPISTTDWTAVAAEGLISWETQTYDVDINANALRWGTLYNFRFDADTCPVVGAVTLGLFKPGDPSAVTIPAEVPGAAITLESSTPPDGSVDARQPTELDGSGAAGWQDLTVLFNRCASDLQPGDFNVTQSTANGSIPQVDDVALLEDGSAVLHLDAPINERVWTAVQLRPDGPRVRLGFQPGDVDGDGTTGALDVVALIDAVTGGNNSLAEWSTDIDRSRKTDLGDIIRLVDLMIGASEYDVYLSTSLAQ